MDYDNERGTNILLKFLISALRGVGCFSPSFRHLQDQVTPSRKLLANPVPQRKRLLSLAASLLRLSGVRCAQLGTAALSFSVELAAEDCTGQVASPPGGNLGCANLRYGHTNSNPSYVSW